MRIVIQPFGDVSLQTVGELVSDLSVFRAMCEVRDAVELPPEAYDARRMQYRSEVLLKLCSRIDGDRVLGIASADLYAEPLNFVFGQAEIGGRACVISTARLEHRNHTMSRGRVAKEGMHELGHTFGLTHCSSPECVMFFSNSLADTDRKGRDYCSDCLSGIPSAWRPRRR